MQMICYLQSLTPIIDFYYCSDDAETQTDIHESAQGPVDLSTMPTTTMNFSPVLSSTPVGTKAYSSLPHGASKRRRLSLSFETTRNDSVVESTKEFLNPQRY